LGYGGRADATTKATTKKTVRTAAWQGIEEIGHHELLLLIHTGILIHDTAPWH
jgi:hypothetical protein